MKKDELLSYVGKKVRLRYYYNSYTKGVLEGVLGYAYEFSWKYGSRQAGDFWIEHDNGSTSICFTAGYVRKVEVIN